MNLVLVTCGFLFLVLHAVAQPVITSFTPTNGAPGTSVAIDGNGFSNASGVFFNNIPALYTVQSNTRITTTVPLEATTGPILVTTPAGSATSTKSFYVAPRVTEFSPASGLPGDSVFLFGYNFIGSTNVTFNGVKARFVVVGDSQITTFVPTNVLSGLIEVSTVVGRTTASNIFVVSGTGPVITEFEPTIGSVGAPVVISGASFVGATAVKFNGTNAVFTVTADTQIHTTVPAKSTTGPITVMGPKGTNTSLANFTVLAGGPAVTGFDPASAPADTVVIITGLNFANTVAVKFGGTNALFAVTADTQIHATVPATAKSGPITVITLTGTNTSTASFTVLAPGPSISDFSPTIGPPGTRVVINGSSFTNVTAVRFNGTNAAFGLTSASQIHATVPTNATTGPISVVSLSGTNTSTTNFVVLPPGPSITSFSPANGAPGQVVTVNGRFFTGATNVQFGGSAASFGVTSDTQLQAQVPTNALTGPITVITPTGTNVSAATFFVAPYITSFAPEIGPVGTPVTVTGLNFSGATSVRIGNAPVTSLAVSNQVLSFKIPTNAATDSIQIITPAGIVASTNAFRVLPTIDSFTPQAGPAGTVVAIHGSGFGGTVAVAFGGAAASFATSSVNRIVATVPTLASTGKIAVQTVYGSTNSTANFTVAPSGDLQVSSTNTVTGPVSWGASVTNSSLVTNLGPSTATRVAFDYSFSPVVQILSAKSSFGLGTVASNRITFPAGSLASGAAGTATVVWKATAIGQVLTTIHVAAQEFDPITTNNLVTVSTTVLEPPRPTLEFRLISTNTFVLSWPSSFSGYVLENTTTLPTGWTNTVGAPTFVADHFFWTNQISGTNRSYRLRLSLP